MANQNQPALLYRNTVEPSPSRHWVELQLVGTRSNRSAIGAEVVVEAGGVRRRGIIDGGMGFASQNDRRLHFGLGAASRVDRVTIYWPSGLVQTLRGVESDQLLRVVEPGPATSPLPAVR